MVQAYYQGNVAYVQNQHALQRYPLLQYVTICFTFNVKWYHLIALPLIKNNALRLWIPRSFEKINLLQLKQNWLTVS